MHIRVDYTNNLHVPCFPDKLQVPRYDLTPRVK